MDDGDQTARAALHELVLDGASVTDFLAELCMLLTDLVLGAHCGFTLQRRGHALTVASNDSVAAHLQEIEQRYAEGPAAEAIRTRACVEVPDLSREARWPAFVGQALATGVGSGVWLPLVVAEESVGVLSVTAPARRAFAEAEVQRAQAIADQAAAGIALALRRSDRLAEDGTPGALQSRRIVDQALGILMHARQIDHADARRALDELARAAAVSKEDMAARIVADGTVGPHEPAT
jgi:GAF domain-containing protein